MGKIKIAIILILIFWCGSSVRIVDADRGQIVSPSNVKIDSATTEINMVLPDEIQRLENDRDRRMKSTEDKIASLEVRLNNLEQFHK